MFPGKSTSFLYTYSTVLVLAELALGLRFSLKIPGNNPKPIKNVLLIYFVLLSVLDQNGLKTKKMNYSTYCT